MEYDMNEQEYDDAKRVEIRNNMHINISNYFLMRYCWSFKNVAAGKLILVLLGCADYENDEDFYRSRIWARELAHYIGVKDRNWSADIRRIITAAKKETINDAGNKISWFDFIEYDKDSQDIIWQINGNLKMLFLGVYALEYKESKQKVGYVNIELKNCMDLKHSYSLRIYIMSMIYAGLRGKIYSVEEFAGLLDLPKSYYKYGLLKAEVLDKAADDICDHTDLRIKFYVDSYKYKRANKVIMFKLTASKIQKDEKTTVDAVVDDIDVNMENGTNYANTSEAEKLLRQYLKDEKTIKRIADNYDYERIRRNVEYVKRAHSKNGVGFGLIVQAVIRDYAKDNPQYMLENDWYRKYMFSAAEELEQMHL